MTRSKKISVPSGFLGLFSESKRVNEISQVITYASTLDFKTGKVDGGPVYVQPYEDGKPFGSRNDAEFTAFIDPVKAAICMASTAVCGILIAAGSAWFSTRKYLRSKIENLY